MQKVGTRERILMAALELFSSKGFDGVGVDEIGAAVGLKGPSIYRHFKGKDDIFNSLFEMGESYYAQGFGRVEKGMPTPNSLDELKQMSLRQLAFTVRDPMIIRFRKLITIEQFRSERIGEIATRHQVTGMKNMYHIILEDMMGKGLIREMDAEILAVEYVYPITVMIQLSDRAPKYTDELISRMEKHIDCFIATYGIT